MRAVIDLIELLAREAGLYHLYTSGPEPGIHDLVLYADKNLGEEVARIRYDEEGRIIDVEAQVDATFALRCHRGHGWEETLRIDIKDVDAVLADEEFRCPKCNSRAEEVDLAEIELAS